MPRLTDEQKANVTKNAELFAEIYEQAVITVANKGFSIEDRKNFALAFVFADMVRQFVFNDVYSYIKREMGIIGREINRIKEDLDNIKID
jgi:hypothetical protein